MVARYKKKRLAEMMSSDESRTLKLEGSERMRAKGIVRKELADKDINTDFIIREEAREDRDMAERANDSYWEYSPGHYVLRSALPKDHPEYRPSK